MGLTVTEDTPADMLAGNMELLVQLPPRIDEDYDNDEMYEGDEAEELRHQHRNHHRHHNHHHNNGHHPRRTVNGNARRVTVARSTPMMDLLVQVATSQKLSASSYTLEAIGEHGLVLTHHPNTPIGALDALQVKLLPKQGTFVPIKTRHVNQPFEQTFRLQVHLPRNQLYVSRVSSRMNLGKILEEVCREKNLDRNNYELCHPANIEETLDLSLSLQDYHLQEVTLCPKRRSMGSSLSSQDIMALQRQEERRRQEAKQSVFGFAFKKSKESSLSTDSLGERSVSPARSDGTGRSASPQAPTAPTRPQRKRRPAPKPPMPRAEVQNESSQNPNPNPNFKGGKDGEREIEKEGENAERIMVISHSRNSSDSSGYHEASVLSDNLDSNIRVPETLPRRTRLQAISRESPGRTLAESSHASKSLGNLAAVPNQRATIARGTSNSSLVSAGLRKKKAAPAPPPPRPLSSSISTQGLERIVDSEESLTSISESLTPKASSDVAVASQRQMTLPRTSFGSETDDGSTSGSPKTETSPEKKTETLKPGKTQDPDAYPPDPSITIPEIPETDITPIVESARERKRAPEVTVPVPKPRLTVGRLENAALYSPKAEVNSPALKPSVHGSMSNLDRPETTPSLGEPEKNLSHHSGEKRHQYSPKFRDPENETPRPKPRGANRQENGQNSNLLETDHKNEAVTGAVQTLPEPTKNLRAISIGDDKDVQAFHRDMIKIPKKPRRKTMESQEAGEERRVEYNEEIYGERGNEGEGKSVSYGEKLPADSGRKVARPMEREAEKQPEEMIPIQATNEVKAKEKIRQEKRGFNRKKVAEPRKAAPAVPIRCREDVPSMHKESAITMNDKSRSCAVISTIPKCDHFQSPIVGEKGRKKSGDEVPGYHSLTRIDSSRGTSFGAGKSILESSGQWDGESIGTSSMTTDVTNSGTDDELELESFEMFERSRNLPKLSTLLRSHSELNNFEINTFEGNGRHLTSRSEDFTFALNPNLVRNISDLSTDAYPDKHLKRHLSLDNPSPSGKGTKKRPAATEIPAFLATTITWEKQELLHSPEVYDARQAGWTVGKSDMGDDAASLSTDPTTKPEEMTSDLLKKVSDTLSGSLRSPTPTVPSSLANEQQPNAHCVDERGTGEAKPMANEAQQLTEPIENPGDTKDPKNNSRSPTDPIDTNFPNNGKPPAIKESEYPTTSDHLQNTILEDLSSTTTDWEYLLPEPPTAFRDTDNVVENRQVFASVASSEAPSVTEDVANKVPRIEDKPIKSKGIAETVVTNGTTQTLNRFENLQGSRPRTVSGSSSDIGSDLTIDRKRLSRLAIKPADSDSRRASQAVSTPSIAPVDNTLSNFVITTYSRPKNVDIFNEIEEKAREPKAQQQIIRKNSSAYSGQNGNIAESRKSSIVSVNKEQVEEKIAAVAEARKNEVPIKNGDLRFAEKNETLESDKNLYNTMSRSNIKISIATKPRPRGDSINESQRPKPVVVSVGSNDFESSREGVSKKESGDESGNHKFSQWREQILNKQETTTTEKQLQSLQVLRSILPQLDATIPNSDNSNLTEKVNTNPSEETRLNPAPLPNNENTSTEPSPASSSTEVPTKRYSYAGPPAINLGSWSDRSRTTQIQIKPDNDYKVENSRTLETASNNETPFSRKEVHHLGASKTAGNSTVDKNSQIIFSGVKTEATITREDKSKENNEIAKTLIIRTTAGSFKRPVSTIIESSGTNVIINGGKEMQRKFSGDKILHSEKREERRSAEEVDEVDERPRNFKELKETFAKDQNTNTLTMPKYGAYGRRSDISSGIKSTIIRRESSLSSNGDHSQVENARVNSKPVVKATSIQEKRNFVIPQPNNRNGVQDAVRRTSRGVLMPVVKGFKMPVASEDEGIKFSQEKRSTNRVAIGDISNGNYVPSQNGLRKTVQVKVDDSSNSVPKPPTMPVITGVTLKSSNHNTRPKSMPVEPDSRNMLLESIRNFGGQNQLRRVPRRNTNIAGGGPRLANGT